MFWLQSAVFTQTHPKVLVSPLLHIGLERYIRARQIVPLGVGEMGITVLLADSVAGMRKIEKAILEKEPDIEEVVGEAGDESEMATLINSLRPQVVVTDFNAQPTGKVFSKQVKSLSPGTKVLAVTEIRGRYVKNFLTVFGADELVDKNQASRNIKARGFGEQARQVIGSAANRLCPRPALQPHKGVSGQVICHTQQLLRLSVRNLSEQAPPLLPSTRI